MYILPCNGMLQGHDPLITENNKKKREADTVRKLFHSPPISQLTLNTKKTQLFKHNLLQIKKKKRISRELKRLGDIALVGSECCCTWLPHSISSQTKTHHVTTDSTAVNPSQVILQFLKKMHGSQVWASRRSFGEEILDTHPFEKFNSLNCHRGEQDYNVLIFESTRRLQHTPTEELLGGVIFCHRPLFVSIFTNQTDETHNT